MTARSSVGLPHGPSQAQLGIYSKLIILVSLARYICMGVQQGNEDSAYNLSEYLRAPLPFPFPGHTPPFHVKQVSLIEEGKVSLALRGPHPIRQGYANQPWLVAHLSSNWCLSWERGARGDYLSHRPDASCFTCAFQRARSAP